jgi:hypothetical protein
VGVLASLLPGVRDLRAPLAAGYVWLLAGWIIFSPSIPEVDDASGPLKAILELGEVAGPFTLGVVVSLGAYLLGALSTEATRWPLYFIPRVIRQVSWSVLDERRDDGYWRRHGGGWLPWTWRPGVSPRGASRLSAICIDRLRATGLRTPELDALAHTVSEARFSTVGVLLGSSRDPHEAGANGVTGEDAKAEQFDEPGAVPLNDAHVLGLTNTVLTLDMDLMSYRLMEAAPQMFGEYDRKRGEGEFRIAVFLPLITLLTVLGVDGSPIWFAALPPMLFFYWQGIRQREAAGDRLIDALALKVVDAPSLELADQLAHQKRYG